MLVSPPARCLSAVVRLACCTMQLQGCVAVSQLLASCRHLRRSATGVAAGSGDSRHWSFMVKQVRTLLPSPYHRFIWHLRNA